jgi:hypothetical protein
MMAVVLPDVQTMGVVDSLSVDGLSEEMLELLISAAKPRAFVFCKDFSAAVSAPYRVI